MTESDLALQGGADLDEPVDTWQFDPDPVSDATNPDGLEPAEPDLGGDRGGSGVDAALALAASRVGKVGGGEFISFWGAQAGSAWCGYFACWVLRQAKAEGPATGWTPGIVTWAKKRNRWRTSAPRRGDLVLFMWPTVKAAGRGSPPVCHVGIVERVNGGGAITTIEGNTSATVGGSQFNGNVCARKVRRTNIVGYVQVDYPDGAQPLDAAALGSAAVRDVQTRLARLGFYTGQIDGSAGPLTRAAILAFQLAAGLEQDGSFGPISSATADRVPPFPGETEPGSQGPVTRAFQARLQKRGMTIDVDGSHGPQTTAVLREFQRAHGLTVDGMGGPQTWTALYTRPV